MPVSGCSSAGNRRGAKASPRCHLDPDKTGRPPDWGGPGLRGVVEWKYPCPRSPWERPPKWRPRSRRDVSGRNPDGKEGCQTLATNDRKTTLSKLEYPVHKSDVPSEHPQPREIGDTQRVLMRRQKDTKNPSNRKLTPGTLSGKWHPKSEMPGDALGCHVWPFQDPDQELLGCQLACTPRSASKRVWRSESGVKKPSRLCSGNPSEVDRAAKLRDSA